MRLKSVAEQVMIMGRERVRAVIRQQRNRRSHGAHVIRHTLTNSEIV
jgi:hypothetical protein